MPKVSGRARRLRVDDFRTSFPITLPVCGLIQSQLMQIPPSEQTRIMAIVKDDLHRVLANRLHGANADGLLAEHEHFLPRPVPFHFRGGRMHPQILERQLKPAAVGKGDFDIVVGAQS